MGFFDGKVVCTYKFDWNTFRYFVKTGEDMPHPTHDVMFAVASDIHFSSRLQMPTEPIEWKRNIESGDFQLQPILPHFLLLKRCLRFRNVLFCALEDIVKILIIPLI